MARKGGLHVPSAKILRTSTQAIADNTVTKVQFATVDFDPFSMWDSTNFQLVIPSGWGGLWLAGTSLRYSAVTTNPARVSLQNGAGSVNYSTCDIPIGGSRQALAVPRRFVAGDTLIAVAFHHNGVSANVGAASTEDTYIWAVFQSF